MRRVWLVVWVLLVATAASAEPIAVQVFSPGEGSAYDDYLKRLTGVIKARYPGKYEFHERLSVGSDDNYRKVRDAGNGIALVQEDVVRHYVEQNTETGVVRIVATRLVNVTNEGDRKRRPG